MNYCLAGNQPSDRGTAKACNNKSICVWAKTHQDFTAGIKSFVPFFSSTL